MICNADAYEKFYKIKRSLLYEGIFSKYFSVKKKYSLRGILYNNEFALMVGDIGLEPMTPCL